jgi:serine/threonine protein kinase/Flp pilus assembly protein TadD
MAEPDTDKVTISNERWTRICEIVDGAVRHEPGADRDRFVAEACGGDEALLEDVGSLLASHEEAASFSVSPAYGGAKDGESVEERKALAEGTELGHYKIVRQIGTGGMGEVYLADDTKLGRQVAIKILSRGFERYEENLRRFTQEAKVLSALNHPNILVIHEIGETTDGHYIVSEYVKGVTLRAVMKEQQMQLGNIVETAIQTATALAAAHEEDLIHRDIKPENLMIRPDGYVKVLDFGLAKLVRPRTTDIDRDLITNETSKGVILGTVNYMSPEQATGKKVDKRTDIFSLGMVLYEMITGRTPFEGDSAAETIANLIRLEPEPLTNFASNIPQELQAIVDKMLRKDPDERHQSMNEVLAELRTLKETMTFDELIERSPAGGGVRTKSFRTAKGVDAKTAETQTSYSNRTLGPLTILLALVLIAGTIGVGVWYFVLRETGRITSIAVLPFQNASGDPNYDYLSDGLSEVITDRLSSVPDLKVIARNSSFRFRGPDDWQNAAQTLGVRGIVTGRVLMRGDSLTIRVELVDVSENRQLWSQQYVRRVTEAPIVPDEIAQTISEKLSLRLSGAVEQQMAQQKTVDPEAFELVLKGRFHSLKGGAEGWNKAVEFYQQAIAADPNYAPAYSGLYWSYRNLITRGVVDPKEFIPKAENAAQRAIELDQNLAEAHLGIAYSKRDAWRWQEAESSYRRALELNPKLAGAHGAYSAYLAVMGRHDEAVAEARLAQGLDPFSPFFATNTGFILYLVRRYDESIETLKKVIAAEAKNPTAHLTLGLAYTEKSMFAEAIAAHREATRLDPVTPGLQVFLGAALARSGDHEQARAILGQVPGKPGFLSPADLAVLHTALGEHEQAIALLEKAYTAHDLQLQYLGESPPYDPLRTDTRFKDLVRRVGLP